MGSKSFKDLLAKAKESDAYWVQSAKLDFALALVDLIDKSGVSKASLAKAMGVSAPYISKVLRGETNLTIESMVKLARALNGKLSLRVSDSACKVRWFETYENKAGAFGQSSNVAPPNWSPSSDAYEIKSNVTNQNSAAKKNETQPLAA